jgi:competence protein ComEC
MGGKTFFRTDWLPAYEPERLALWSPVALGIGIGIYFALPFEPPWLAPALGLLLATVAVVRARGDGRMRLVFSVFLGFASACLSPHVYGTPMLDWPMGPLRVSGRVAEVELQENGAERLVLENPTIPNRAPEETPHRLRLKLKPNLVQKAGDVQPGDRFSAVAKLMPFSDPLVPEGFDFRRNAYFQGLGATGYAMGKIERQPPDAEAPRIDRLTDGFNRLRQEMRTLILDHLSGDRAGMAAIFLTGNKALLSAETADAMRAIGLAHLLAIAGLHVGLVAGIVFALVRGGLALWPTLALRWPIKKTAALCALAAIAFYTLQVGAPVPTRRSFLMVGLALIGVMVDRVTFSVRTITLAAFVLLLIGPHLLLNPGFQLSFAAVLGLISVGEATRERQREAASSPDQRSWSQRFWRATRELAGMSFVALAATFPYSLYHFQEGGLYSVLSNTLAIPLTSFLIMPLCVFVDLLWPFGLAWIPLRLLDLGFGALIALAHKIGALPGAHALLPPLPLGWMLAATAGGLWFCLTRGRRRLWGIPVYALSLALGLLTFDPPAVLVSADGHTVGWRDDDGLHVTTLDRRVDPFLTEIWRHRLSLPPDAMHNDLDAVLACTPEVCVKNFDLLTLAWLRTPDALLSRCAQGTTLILNPHNDEICPQGSLVWTYERFTKQGAMALWPSKDGFRIETARPALGTRPWSLRPGASNEPFQTP